MSYGQTTVYFKYDDGGNQRYRGLNASGKSQAESDSTQVVKPLTAELSEEDKFLLGVNLYPVPVKEILTIAWNEENDQLINYVTLYQHNSISYLYHQQNLSGYDRHMEINMSGYMSGVYIVSFELKDGRVISKNILKE